MSSQIIEKYSNNKFH